MKTEKIPTELKKFRPFFHDIDLGNGYNTAPESNRMKEMENMYFPILTSLCGGSLKGKRVLDVGCNCGGFSFAAKRLGAKEVVGIDSDSENIDKANAIKKYLELENVKFLQIPAEEISREILGDFDVTILAGILYHLSEPLQVLRRISEITKNFLVVDSHVHYSSNPLSEDVPSWLMLSDTDMNDLDGLFSDNEQLADKYLEFEVKNPVDYSILQNQFSPSPHTDRDLKFVKENIPNGQGEIRADCNIGSVTPGQLVFIPNKKAILKAVRFFGFEDVVEIVPHRFASHPYTNKYRLGLVAIKREENAQFPISILHQKLNKES